MFKFEGMKNDSKNIFLTSFILLCFGFGWGQTTTLSGTTVTMFGTHDDLSSLASISGVNTTSSGNQIVYILDYALKIEGSLNHDPEKEKLIFSSSAPYISGDNGGSGNLVVANGGTYNYGVRKAGTDPTGDYSEGIGLVFLRPQNAWTSQRGLLVSGGTMNWRGGTILTASSLRLLSTTTIYQGVFVNLNASSSEAPRFSIDSNDVTIHQLITDKASDANGYGRIEIKFGTNPTLSGIVQKGGYYQTEGDVSFEDQALGANSSGRLIFPYHGANDRYSKTISLTMKKVLTTIYKEGLGTVLPMGVLMLKSKQVLIFQLKI